MNYYPLALEILAVIYSVSSTRVCKSAAASAAINVIRSLRI